MELKKKSDIKLVMRAMRSGWNVPDDVKQECVAQLAAIAAGAEKDSDRVAAIKALMLADSIDAKRERSDDERKLRLVELAKSLPVGELARLASTSGVVDGVAGIGRAVTASDKDGGQTR